MLAERTSLPMLTDRLPLGSGGLAVSPFAIGMVERPDVIPAAYEAGINFFFVTADMHWPYYENTRRGLEMLLQANPAARDEIVLGVVSYVTQPEFLWAPFEEVLQASPALARIDLTIAGGAYGHEITQRLETFKIHRETAHAGARAIGATFHDRNAARQLLDHDVLDIAFVRSSPPFPGARRDLFPHVKARPERRTLLFNFKSTVGYIGDAQAYEALGIGPEFWRPHVTDYYRFALTEPALDGILCSPPSPAAIGELADAMARGPLDADDAQYMLDLGEVYRGIATVR